MKAAWILLCPLLCCADKRPSAPPPLLRTQTLERAQPFPAVTRKAIDSYMLDHGEDMENLLWGCLMLDYDLIAATTQRMTDRPRLSRPSDDLSSLNALLPPAFFAMQDELSKGVTDLRIAAQKHDDAAIGHHYARIAETCVGCHSLYLKLPATAGPRQGQNP